MVDGIIEQIGNVDFELTYLCNLNCLHCYNPTHKKSSELSLKKIKSVTDEIKEVGFEEIHFNGGEPLLRKDIYEILEHAHKIGLRTLLETNATLLTKPEKMQNLKNVQIRASIDGPEQIHNLIRKGENSYKKTMSNLEKCKKNDLSVQVTCSVNKINCNHIYEMVNDLTDSGIDDIRLRLSMPTQSSASQWRLLEMNKKDLQTVMKQSSRIKDSFKKISFDYSSIKRSYPNQTPKCFIDPRGLVKPYPFIEHFIGDIKKDSITDIVKRISLCVFPKKYEEKIKTYLRKLEMI